MKKKICIAVIMAAIVAMMSACGSKGKDKSTDSTNDTAAIAEASASAAETEPRTEISTEADTQAQTEPSTEPPTEAPTEPPTEAPTEAYVGAWTLLTEEPLNPKTTGYEELDRLVSEKRASLTNDGMNGYQKVWAIYEWMVDNITYSRGMDANTGAYSSSDPATTPKEVLWATDLLNSGMGCCYNYSAAFTYIMQALGYDAHLVTGNVPKYGGGVTPHCWLYVNLAGQRYTFDPDLDMNFYTRDVNNGVEGAAKDRFFCAPVSQYSYFYTPDGTDNN